MKPTVTNRRRHDILTGLLLAMLLIRAYVPVGFMPASGSPFLLELCPAASPMPASPSMPNHHGHQHHAETHDHFANCPFGSAPAAGPISHVVAFQPPGQPALLTSVEFESLRLGTRLPRAHQPRGPPSPV